MQKKGQAAMEFLMTYGWAILVVLAAVGALAYFGVLNPGRYLPQQCNFGGGIDCTETPVADNSEGTITVALTNSVGYNLNYTCAATIGSSENYGCAITYAAGAFTAGNITDNDGDGVWENGETAIVTFGGCTLPDAGDRFSTNLNFQYQVLNSGMVHPATGKVTGEVAS